jgi:hypothetical protein
MPAFTLVKALSLAMLLPAALAAPKPYGKPKYIAPRDPPYPTLLPTGTGLPPPVMRGVVPTGTAVLDARQLQVTRTEIVKARDATATAGSYPRGWTVDKREAEAYAEQKREALQGPRKRDFPAIYPFGGPPPPPPAPTGTATAW